MGGHPLATVAYTDNAIEEAIDGVNVQISAIPTIPKNTVAIFGDSITWTYGNVDDEWDSVNKISGVSSRCFITWANTLLGQRLNIIGNFGISGNTTTQMLARIDDVIAIHPAYCIVLGGTNDVWDTEASVTEGNLLDMYETLIGAGITVVAVTIPPSTWATAVKQRVITINSYIKSLRSSLKNYLVCDAYEAIVNPASDEPLTGMTFDNLHPKTLGGYAIGKALYAVLDPLIPALSPFTGVNDPRNKYTNPYLLGGTAIAPNWSVLGMTEGKYTATKVARNGGLEWQQFDVSEIEENSFCYQVLNNGFSVGDKITAYVEYETDEDATNVGHFGLALGFLNSGWESIGKSHGMCADNDFTDAFPADGHSGILRTPRVSIPTGTAMIYFNVYFTQTGKFRIGRTLAIIEPAS
jgi:lysophospholipase L1-like esterase